MLGHNLPPETKKSIIFHWHCNHVERVHNGNIDLLSYWLNRHYAWFVSSISEVDINIEWGVIFEPLTPFVKHWLTVNYPSVFQPGSEVPIMEWYNGEITNNPFYDALAPDGSLIEKGYYALVCDSSNVVYESPGHAGEYAQLSYIRQWANDNNTPIKVIIETKISGSEKPHRKRFVIFPETKTSLYEIDQVVTCKDNRGRVFQVSIDQYWLNHGFYGTVQSGEYSGMTVNCIPWHNVIN